MPGDHRRHGGLLNAIRSVQGEGGQAVVEFALVLPLLLMVVVAIFQVATVFRNYATLTDAVRAGARVAAVSATAADPTGTAVTAVVTAGTDLGLTPGQVAVASAWTPGATVTVTATYPYTLSLFGMSLYTGNLNSQTTERVE